MSLRKLCKMFFEGLLVVAIIAVLMWAIPPFLYLVNPDLYIQLMEKIWFG